MTHVHRQQPITGTQGNNNKGVTTMTNRQLTNRLRRDYTIMDGTTSITVGRAIKWGYTWADDNARIIMREINRRAMTDMQPLTAAQRRLMG